LPLKKVTDIKALSSLKAPICGAAAAMCGWV